MSVKSVPKKGYKSVPWLFGKEIEIPEEWEFNKLHKFVSIQSGEYFHFNEFSEEGIPVLKIDNVMHGKVNWETKTFLNKKYLDSHKEILLNEGDILLALNRPVTHNQVKVARLKSGDIPSILYQRVGRFVFKNNYVRTDFFYSFLNSYFFKDILSRILIGSDQPYVRTTELLTKRIPVPPLHEQQKIASILSNVDNLIQNTDKLIEKTTRLKKGLMQELLVKGIGHTKFKKIILLPKHIVITIPEEWKPEIIKNVLIEKIQNGINIKLENYGTGFPIFEIESLYKSDLIIEQSNLRLVSIENIKNHEQYKLKENDFVLNRVSKVKEGVGKCLLIKNPIENLLYEGNMIRIRIDQNCIYPMFLAFQTKSTLFFNYIQSTCKTTSLTSIDQGIIEKIPIPLPPLPEQQKIASILSNTDEKIQSYKRYKEKLQRLKKSLMQKLLTGEVRVAV